MPASSRPSIGCTGRYVVVQAQAGSACETDAVLQSQPMTLLLPSVSVNNQKFSSAMLRTLVKRGVPGSLRKWLRQQATRHVHTIVQDAGTGYGFAIFGDRLPRLHFERVYLGSGGATAVGRLHGGNWSHTARALAKRYGLVVASGVEVPADVRPEMVRLPRFVALSVELGDSEESFFRSLPVSARSDISKVRREEFEPEVHRDVAWVEEFVAGFHEKSVGGRHGAEGFVLPARDIKWLLHNRNCEFVCVTQRGRRVAALLAESEPAGYRMRQLGWLNGDPELAKKGVVGAAYWFAMRRARELGLGRVRLGGTPPYLEDGLFKFKMKWNATLDHADTRFGEYLLLMDPGHPRVDALLRARSLITLDASDRFVIVGHNDPQATHLSDRMLSSISGWVSPRRELK